MASRNFTGKRPVYDGANPIRELRQIRRWSGWESAEQFRIQHFPERTMEWLATKGPTEEIRNRFTRILKEYRT
jgi:hypothetical protein